MKRSITGLVTGISILLCMLWLAPAVQAQQNSPCTAPQVKLGPDVSRDLVDEARAYRDEGRYELARQSYAKAIATCQSHELLVVIKQEMAGVELLLRTMR